MKFNINANTYEKSERQSPNFVRSNQESLGANSLVINTNDATKGKNDESSKIEQILTDMLCLVAVKYFSENKYFLEMLFYRKENIFKCLVAL